MVAEFLPQHLLSLGVSEVGRRLVDAFPLLLRAHRDAIRSWKGGTRRRGLDTVRRAPRHHAAAVPHHEHPHRGSGAGAGRLPHWSHPGSGVSSFGTSTTATWPPLTGASAGKIDGAVTAMVMTAVVVFATCCGSVAVSTLCGASLVATAVLPITHGALDERCLVGMDVSALNALAGAGGGGGTGGATLQTQKQKV
jgi:hypothetical protein